MISALIHIALISAKAVLALIATILIVPGLGIAATVWYIRRWRARKLRPQIALEALNQRYAVGDISRTDIYRTVTTFSPRNSARRWQNDGLKQ